MGLIYMKPLNSFLHELSNSSPFSSSEASRIFWEHIAVSWYTEHKDYGSVNEKDNFRNICQVLDVYN